MNSNTDKIENQKCSKEVWALINRLNQKVDEQLINMGAIAVHLHTDKTEIRTCINAKEIPEININKDGIYFEQGNFSINIGKKINMIEYIDSENAYYIKMDNAEIYLDFI